MFTYSELLTADQVERIHQASLHILAEVGLLVRNERARQIFARHGCWVDEETHLVRFPIGVVEEFRQMFPSKFIFRGRDERFDKVLPDDSPVIVTASSAPNIIDPVTGQERRATSEDIARIAYLVNELPGYDVFSVSTLAEDAPPGYFTLARLYPALKNCLKPVRSTATDLEDARRVLQLGELIAGDEKTYAQRPFITHHFCPVVSPLTMDVASTELTIFFAEKGLPVYPSIVPNGGLTAPMTMSGTLVQGNAEFLAAAVLMQMVRPQTPLIYSTLPTIADMRTGAYASGGVECGMLHMAFAQMARFYGVPCGGYIGLSNSKVNDAQAGYETGISCTAALLGGAHMLNMGGLLDALKAFDYAKAVIDDEIAQMLKRIRRGMEFNEENLALDVIAEVKPGGNFMTHKHTVKWMRKVALMPRIADREPREVWEKRGALDAFQRAKQRAAEVLSKPTPVSFPPEIEARIRSVFPEMVHGEVIPVEGW
ncbi:MAG: trimethylamine methyltransferase family protein [Anaerolineales bacterium]|nr:trimethylamine methyltransferase family protein [Anaerolineales bacterium]MDW8162748.1 trimethylamine methyltransferase family protein [Anaerolineales bacterium]